MRTSLVTGALVAFASSACASIDNSAVQSAVDSAATGFTGVYNVKNVATGQYMTFTRNQKTDTTDLLLQDSGNVTLTYLSNQKGSDGTFSGTRIYGLSKCASAQWNIGDGDYAAASYACAIGDDATSDTGIHVAKQLWSFIECSKGSTATKKIAVAEVAATQSAAAMAKCDNSEQWVYEHRSDKEVASACADKLKNYESRHPELSSRARRMAKRTAHRHHDLATRALDRRADKEYCIVAQDHLGDMSARAIAGKAFNSWNEYTSLRLTDYDSSSVTDEQRWVVTRA